MFGACVCDALEWWRLCAACQVVCEVFGIWCVCFLNKVTTHFMCCDVKKLARAGKRLPGLGAKSNVATSPICMFVSLPCT